MPEKAYHASGLDASQIDMEKIDEIVLKSSQSGAMTPGVYMAPYIENMYFGGDQARNKVNVPVVFEITPDQDCLSYFVNHGEGFKPIEITTQWRDCRGFTKSELINVDDSDLPIVHRLKNNTHHYKQVLLISGNTVLKRPIHKWE